MGNELDLGEEDFKEAAVLMLNRLIGIDGARDLFR